MRAGDEPANVAAAAVYAFARELVLTRGKVAEGTIRRTVEAGLSEADVLEVVAECTFAGLVGTLDNLAGRVELDEPFRQATWSAP